jgi:nicotinamide mononucleotide transporter
LLALKKESNFIFGAIAVILFAIIGYFTKNWFYVVLNGLYYLPFNILGYFQWKNNKKGSNSNELKVKKMNTNIFLSLLSGVILCGVAISFVFYIPFVRTWLNDKSPTNEPVYWIKLILNGLVLILSVVAMQLVIRAYQEQWRFWLIANVCMLILWATNIWDGISNNNLQYTFVSAFTLFTYTFSFANSVYGYISWKEKK